MMKSRAAVAVLITTTAAMLLAGCSPTTTASSDGKTITVWSQENQPDRVNATKAIIEKFTKETGIKVKLVAVDETQFPQLVASSGLSGKLPDVMGAVSLSNIRQLADQKMLNTDAAASIVKDLDPKTFREAALKLDSQDGEQLAVPDSAYSQILVYRKDLFEKAGLKPPTTYQAIQEAAQKLTADGTYGITLATDPADVFTSQTFESLAVGNDCNLVDTAGKVTLDSASCKDTWNLYSDLAQKYSPKGTQTVDTTRASYFAGQAAMVDWSTYLLDELGGLRNDALPTCPECAADPTWLAKNSGIVTSVSGPDGKSAGTYGEIASWAVMKNANVKASTKFIEYMLSTGYLDWVGMAPEGKVPARMGDASDLNKYIDGWKKLDAGVDTRKPLSAIYDAETMDALENIPKQIDRWAIPQGKGALLGPMNAQLVIPKAIADLSNGSTTGAQAAKDATEQVTQLEAKIK
jgi:multiple sugar transport system substrate-binding protein